MREPHCSRQLRLLSVTLAALLLTTLGACSGGSKPATEGPAPGPSAGQPRSLTEALALIRAEEAAAQNGAVTRAGSAFPDTVLGDAEWFAGPPGGFSENFVAHTMQLTSAGSDPEDPNHIAYAIYKLTNHASDLAEYLDLSLTHLSGEYWVYLVDYTLTPVWHEYGPFSAAPPGPGWPLDLRSIDAVSTAGNVYVAILTAGDADISVNSMTVTQETPPPPDYYETEPNDSFETANALPPFDFNLEDVTGNVGGSDPADWFSFVAATAGRVYLTLVLPAATGDLDLEVYDTDGGSLLDLSDGTEKAERCHVDISTPGMYYVRVLPGNGGSGDYQLWGTYADSGEDVMSETEPNDSAGVADAFPPLPFPDPTVMGSASPADLDDYFTFQANELSQVTLTMYTDRDNPPQLLELLASDGETLMGIDVQGGALYQTAAAVQTGTYFLHVRSSNGPFEYELRAEIKPFDPNDYYEVEPNDNDQTANPLPPFDFNSMDVTGDVGSGGLYDGSESDWFSFSVAEEGTVKLVLFRTFGVGEPMIQLIDTDGVTVLADSSTAVLPESISYYFAAPGGPYFLRTAASDSGWYDYGLTGTFRAGIGSYTEVEDNDDSSQANTLPAFPFNNNAVTGNLGLEGDYNQDEADWFEFTTASAGTVNLVLRIDSVGADLDMELLDSNGDQLDQSVGVGITETINSDVLPAGTYFVRAYVYSGSNDASSYSLDGNFSP